MIERNRKIWEKLEESIGRCILFKDAAMKEVLGEDSFTLQFATLSVPERVEAFLESAEGIKIIRNEVGSYIFALDGTRVEIHCFNADEGFEKSYEKMFNRIFRCENLGINILGRYNRNMAAYNDVVAKELHFTIVDAKLTEFLVGKLVRYILNNGFSVGDDILKYIKNNRVFENKAMRNRFLGAFADSVRKNRCTWERAAKALMLIEDLLPSSDFIQYTAKLDESVKTDKFIRNYLYGLFIALDITGQELHKIIPNESTIEYFDSLAINAYACLGEYKVYIEIKNNYGEEFLELLMDVQESIAMSLGIEYVRVSDETFDMGELFLKDERFWCSLEEMKKTEVIEEKKIPPEVPEETLDASKGNAAGWIADKYNKDMYSDVTESTEDKIYIDDEVEQETFDTGIDTSALDAYENETVDGENDETTPAATVQHPKLNEGIMNSQRGHESKVLNSGGI